jgi:NADPH:quinone reductase-like Zn-dependent oxidoreductase
MANSSMNAYEIQTATGIEGLRPVERSRPTPGFGDVLIRVHATSLNYRDLVVVQGGYGKLQLPLVPLSDGAGEVVELGEGVTRVKVGDRVAGIFFQTWLAGKLTKAKTESALGGAIAGMLSEYVVLHQDGLVQLPAHLSYEQGATLPCAAVTAWQSLVSQGNLTAGETVLILGTGGVSIFALQFAKLLGARVIITSSSDVKLERAKALGADETINYTETPDWERRVFELTDRVGVDHIVEVGGAGTLAKSLKAAAIGGRISLIGVLSGGAGEVNPRPATIKALTLQGIYVGSREMFEAMNRAIALHQLQPLCDRVFPFNAAPEAYHYLKSGSHFGKVVIRL